MVFSFIIKSAHSIIMEAKGPVTVSGRVTGRVLLLAEVSEAVNVPSMPVSCVHSSKG